MNSASLSQVLLSPPVQSDRKGGDAGPSYDDLSFAKFLQKRADQQLARQNQLGAAQKAEAQRNREIESDRQEKKAEENRNAAAYLLAILNEMRQMARDGAGTNGAFILQGIDRQQFESLLQSMGLGADEAGSFGQFLTEVDGPLRLDDFLTMLASRLQKLTQAEPVTIQETDLPFIQSLLDRFGMSASQIRGATEVAVTGDNQLDLSKLVAGLKDLANSTQQVGGSTAGIALSEWDLEQLQNMISEAGLTDENRQALLLSGALQAAGLDELTAFLQQKIDAGQLPVPLTADELAALSPDKLATLLDKYGLTAARAGSLTLDQLTSFLDNLAAAVRGQRPKIDLASFAERLDGVFQNAKPGGGQPAWTPLMQDCLQKVYDKLREIVDFSKISVTGKDDAAARPEYLAEQATFNEAADADALATLAAEGKDSGSGGTETTAEQKAVLNALLDIDQRSSADATDAALSLNAAKTGYLQPRDSGPVNNLLQPSARPTLGVMEQQLFDQISKGVLRGIQNGEHHLVLKLHPPELGEVQVELMVHHDQVSVSFAMENSKVKQAMENNMQQFRDNLTQRGFVLQNCFVSVGNGNDRNDVWRRFEQAMRADKVQTVRRSDVPGELLYQRRTGRPLTDGGISVFI